jgi:hypothetical protein
MQQGQVFELKKRAVDGRPMGVPVSDRRSGFETVTAGRLLLRA